MTAPLPGMAELLDDAVDEQAARRYLVDRVGMSDDEARETLAAPVLGLTSGHTGRPPGCPCQFPPTDTRNCACAKTPLIGDL